MMLLSLEGISVLCPIYFGSKIHIFRNTEELVLLFDCLHWRG